VTRPAAVVIAAGLTLTMAGLAGLHFSRGSTGPPEPSVTTTPPALPVDMPVTKRVAVPVAINIPAIGVTTRLLRLGRTASGALQVPDSFTVAGWYDLGPRPGEPGPAVIAGHVDSLAGPAVFYRLGELRNGDRVYVRRADGTSATFTVTGVLMYAKSGFPADAVYGPVPVPQLRLITCGGTFNYARHSYLSNVVVYASETG
jgi:hypothetical protein